MTKEQSTVDIEEQQQEQNEDHAHIAKLLHKDNKEEYDAALKFLQDNNYEELEYTEQEARKVLWKIDLFVLPLMTGTFILNFIDKGILSNASVFGLLEDLNLKGDNYSWLVSAFYFGYMAGLPFTVYVLHKMPAGLWLVINLFFWGLSLISMAGAHNFSGGVACRFFLGVFEACVNPVMVLLTSQYYTRKEHSLRSCIWWAGNAVGSLISDFVTYGFGMVDGALSTWKYMFICFGAITILYSLLMYLVFPKSPMTMPWLTQKERVIAVARVLENNTGIAGQVFKWYQVYECLKDFQVWVFFAVAFIQCLPSGGVTNFNKLIMTGLGYTNLESIIMGLPEIAIHFLSIVVAGICGSYIKNCRCLMIILSNIPCLVGSCLVYYLPESHKLQRLAGLYIIFTNTVAYIMCMSLVSSNLAGMTKKNTAGALMFLAYCIGNLVSPRVFLESEYPKFQTGFKSMVISFALLIALGGILWVYLFWENRRRDKKYGKPELFDTDLLEDLTDWDQKKTFRYNL